MRGKELAPFTLKGKVNLLQLSKLEVNLTINNLALSHYLPYLREHIPFTYLTGESNLNLNCQIDKEKNLYLTGRIEGENIGVKFLSSSAGIEFPLERIDNLNFSLDLKLTGKVARLLEISQLEGNLNIDQGEIRLFSWESGW